MNDRELITAKHDKKWYTSIRTIESFNAGYTFGKLYQSYVFLVDCPTLDRMIDSLKVKKSLDLDVYRQGFICGFMKDNPNPEFFDESRYVKSYTVSVSESEEATTMGQLSEAKASISGSMYPFVRPVMLADLQVVFCIEAIRAGMGKFGPQWLMTILVDEDSRPFLSCSDDGHATVTLSSTVARDALFERLQNMCPIHHCMFEEKVLKNGQKFIDLVETSMTCACGHKMEETPQSAKEVQKPTESKVDQKALEALKKKKQTMKDIASGQPF